MERIPIKQYARQLRRNQTPGEKALRALYLLLYLPQWPVVGKIPDWYSPIWKVAIEVDGGVHRLPWVKEKDKRKRRHFKRHGIYTVKYADWYARRAAALVFLEILITSAVWTLWRFTRWIVPKLMI